MGLKSKLSKMKSFLFDEEEEKPKEKKTVSNKEEPKIDKKEVKEPVKSTNFDDFYFEDISSKDEIISDNNVKSRTARESEFKFPEFNDDDFMPRVREEKKVEIKVKKEEKPLLYQGSKRREETKKFKPSPIISPIYGLLDEDGNMKKTDSKSSDTPSKKRENITIEDIRKKAYGTLDEEYENTMSRLSKKTIEEAETEMEKEKEEKPNEKVSKAMVSYKKKIDEDNDDDMILPNVNFKEIDIDKEHSVTSKKEKVVSKEDNDDEDTKEQDLFNLIDTIYSGEESDK